MRRPEAECLDRSPHGPHNWASLTHHWRCPGRKPQRRRPTFDWWDDAVEVARSIASTTGVRQRVHYVAGPKPWHVSPAVVRLVEVPC